LAFSCPAMSSQLTASTLIIWFKMIWACSESSFQSRK
jgi:hypothetical protein